MTNHLVLTNLIAEKVLLFRVIEAIFNSGGNSKKGRKRDILSVSPTMLRQSPQTEKFCHYQGEDGKS